MDTQNLPRSAVGDSERDCRAPTLPSFVLYKVHTVEEGIVCGHPPETATVNLFVQGNEVHNPNLLEVRT